MKQAFFYHGCGFQTVIHSGIDFFIKARHGTHDGRLDFRNKFDDFGRIIQVDIGHPFGKDIIGPDSFKDMAQRQKAEADVAVIGVEEPLVMLLGLKQNIGMGQHDPFGLSGGAGRVDQCQQVLFFSLVKACCHLGIKV